MKWSAKLIKELNEIVNHLKKNSIGSILEPLANFFIEKHEKYINVENYAMDFLDDVEDSSVISDGEYKLAYICELVYHKTKKTGVYFSLSYMIIYCIKKKYKIDSNKIDYKGFYLLSLLKEYFLPNEKTEGKDDPIYGVLNITITIVKEIIQLSSIHPKIIYCLSSSMSQCEQLDMNLLNTSIIRAIMDILKTKRTIFVRLLFVLTYEIVRISNVKDLKSSNWVYEKIKFNNKTEFLDKLNSPLIETILFLTSKKI